MPRFISLLLSFLLVSIASASEPVTWQRAIDRDDAQALWRLLPDADVKKINDKGKTALMSAARLGDQKLYDALKAKGLSAADRSFTGGTTLMYAALGNQLSMIRIVHGEQNNPLYLNAQSTNGWTALMIAAAKGFEQAVELLVELGADPALADAYQWSPLMRAIDNRHRAVVQYLLSLSDININATNENGSTALHVAVLMNDEATVRQLLQAGVDISVADAGGKTAYDIAVNNDLQHLVAVLAAGSSDQQ
jgi:ankyrin repeat protein